MDVETLQGVAGVTISSEGQTVQTGQDGTFLIDLKPGRRQVQATGEGYGDAQETAKVLETGLEDFLILLFKEAALQETIVVHGFDTLDTQKTVAGHTEVSRDELLQSAGTRGDALHAVRNLPGVANVDPLTPGEFAFGIVVRGSSAEDSNVMVNGIELPILYHFFGLQSVMPSEVIEDIEFIPGGFDVQYGNSTGGIVNIHTRAGKSPELSGFAEVSFISVSGHLEGPISKKHDLWFSAGFRRSVIDAVLPLALPDDSSLSFTTLPQYYDSQLRVDWDPSPEHNLMFMAFTSWDFASGEAAEENPLDPNASGTFENQVGFERAALSYHFKKPKTELFARSWVGDVNYEFQQGNTLSQSGDGIVNGATIGARHKPASWLQLRTGGEYNLEHYRGTGEFPLPPQEGQDGFPNSTTGMSVILSEDIQRDFVATYVAADFDLGTLRFTTGLRYDNFLSNDAQTLSPRGSMTYGIGENWSASASVSRHTLQSRGVEILRPDLKPEESIHYVAGVKHTPAEGVEITMTGFLKDLSELAVYDEALIVDSPIDGYINRGTGRVKGLETMIRARRHNWFGWLSYSLQRSERNDGPGLEDRLFDFDQTHNLVALGSYQYGPWRFGGRFQFTSGEPDTPLTGSMYNSDVDAYTPVYGETNSIRKANAHQLDLRVERNWSFEAWRLSAYLDVTNVYAHARPIAKAYNFNYSKSEDVTTVPLFPALGLRGSF